MLAEQGAEAVRRASVAAHGAIAGCARYCIDVSEDNVQLVRHAYQLAKEQGLEAFVAFFEDDAVLHPPDGWPSGPWRGREAIREQLVYLQGMATERGLTLALEATSDDAKGVVVRNAWEDRAGERSMPRLWHSAAVRIRDGKFAEVHVFIHHSDALRIMRAW